MNNQENVKAVYDSGSNVNLVNFELIKKLKAKIFQEKRIFKTLGGMNFTQGRAKLHLRINRIEEEIDVYVVRNNFFSYDLLLGLDAIKKFRLSQDENLNIFQRVEDSKLEQVLTTKKKGSKKKKIMKKNQNVVRHTADRRDMKTRFESSQMSMSQWNSSEII